VETPKREGQHERNGTSTCGRENYWKKGGCEKDTKAGLNKDSTYGGLRRKKTSDQLRWVKKAIAGKEGPK